MRFISSIFAGAALIAAALAVEINEAPSTVESGKSYPITYSPKTNAATTFILRKGDSDKLANLTTLTNSATGGKYTWNVDPGLPDGDDYALMVIQEGDANYWGPIKLTGSSVKSLSLSSSASSSATPTSSSSSASSTSESSASTTASASASSSAGGNSTVSSATLSSTGGGSSSTARSSSTGSPTSGGGPPESTGAASSLGSSPLALIFGAVAAMAYLN